MEGKDRIMSKWIRDEFPPVADDVLVITQDGNYAKAYYCKDGTWNLAFHGYPSGWWVDTDEIIAWMPLPKKPKWKKNKLKEDVENEYV